MKKDVYVSNKAPGFEFTFDPIEDTIDITTTRTGTTIIRYATPDPDARSPREEWDNLGTMICFHTRYNLGDKHAYTMEDYGGWGGLSNHLVQDEAAWVLLPLYLLDHSGITMRTSSFNDSWDSGRVGIIYMTRAQAVEAWGNLPENELKEKAKACLESEVKCYDMFLTGDVYGVVKETFDADKDSIDCDHCWGFFGLEYAKEEVPDFEKETNEELGEVKVAPVTRKIEWEAV